MREDITKASRGYWDKAGKWIKKFSLKPVKVKEGTK